MTEKLPGQKAPHLYPLIKGFPVRILYTYCFTLISVKKPFTTCLKPCPLKLEQRGMKIKNKESTFQELDSAASVQS